MTSKKNPEDSVATRLDAADIDPAIVIDTIPATEAVEVDDVLAGPLKPGIVKWPNGLTVEHR
jgi:hypothetical protein